MQSHRHSAEHHYNIHRDDSNLTFTIGVNCRASLNDLQSVALYNRRIQIDPELEPAVNANRQVVNSICESGAVVYGINTGFGVLANVVIEPKDLKLLQSNLIASHAVGIGSPTPRGVVRAMMFLRLVGFCQCASGIRFDLIQQLVNCLNAQFIPFVPHQGTVGASGDLAPLSHVAYALCGFGLAYDVESDTYIDAAVVMTKLGLKPIVLEAKEGLALNNGTQFITSILAFATIDAVHFFDQLLLTVATTLEALRGTYKAFDAWIHQLKPHPGQIAIAEKLREILMPDVDSTKNNDFAQYGSDIYRTYGINKVQDAYSLRCVPQILGPFWQDLQSVIATVEIEMNSVSDNPLVNTVTNSAISGGNFHGMPIAYAADKLSMISSACTNLVYSLIDRLMDPSRNGFLPAFLVTNPGLNSGLMMVQYTVAALTAENRNHANPAFTNTLPTCNGTEDVVSMGGYAARKAQTSVDNSYKALANLCLACATALDFTPEQPNRVVSAWRDAINNHITKSDTDRYMYNEITNILAMLYEHKSL